MKALIGLAAAAIAALTAGGITAALPGTPTGADPSEGTATQVRVTAVVDGDTLRVEDLAGLIPDDLRGWFENRDGERVREPGILESFNLDAAEAEALIMRARIVMGWVEAPPEPEVEEVEEEYVDDADAEVSAQAEETPEA